MVRPGVVNLDFADVRTILKNMGDAIMGTGIAHGEEKAIFYNTYNKLVFVLYKNISKYYFE